MIVFNQGLIIVGDDVPKLDLHDGGLERHNVRNCTGLHDLRITTLRCQCHSR